MKSNKFFKRNFVLLLALGTLVLSGVATYSSFIYKQDIETNAAVGSYTTNPNTYYASVENKTQNQLLWGLHDLMISTHRTYTAYDDMGSNNYQGYTDKDPNNSNNILAFYSRASIAKAWSGGVYDREHVWPQSLSNGLFTTSNAGSDMHHIRPTIKTINNTRGNKLFGNVSSGTSITYGTGNLVSKHGSNTFEPHDQVKGDAARIIMYMFVHYNSSKALGNGNNVEDRTGTLPITNVIQGANNKAAFDLLLNWHELDPVDGLEITRNDQVAIYQGNRNPFIDRPEFASYIWGEGVAPTTLSIIPNTYSVAINEEKTLSVTATPTGANKSVNWSSSNTNVVSVTNGIVKGISVGSATITATSTLNSSVKATATVTVSNISVTGVSLPSTITMNLNETQTIIPTFIPTNASNKNVTWTSSDTSVATIHSTSGLVTAKKVGTSTITVTTQDSNKVASSTLEVIEMTGADVTYTIATTDSVTTSETKPPSSSATYTQTYGTAGQYVGKNGETYGSLTLKNYLGYKITKIILSMKSNTSSGGGRLEYSSNGGTDYTTLISDSKFNTAGWNGSWSTSYVNIEKSLNIIATSSDIIFKITATENSLYCQSFTIVYDAYVVLDHIELVSPPSQMSYFEGEDFNYMGLEVKAHYSNNTSNDVSEDVEVTPNPLTYGTTSVAISYTDNGITKSINLNGISVTRLVLSSITINSCPYVTTYPLGSSQDFMGLTLLATYTNGHTTIINDGYITSLNTLLLGEQVVNVTYGGKSTSFDAYVTNENASVNVSVTPLQQAIAWSNYFLKLTSPTCLQMSGDFSPYWNKLETEFNYFASASKDQLFYNETNNEAINQAIERYIFIIEKYSSIEDFVTNSSNEALNANRQDGSFYKNDNNLLILIILLSLIVPSTLYLFFKLKKKRLN